MKKLVSRVFIIVVLFSAVLSCDKNDYLSNEGIVIGADLSKCSCCGGYFVEIENDTLRFLEIPKASDIDLSADEMPIAVKVNWKKVAKPCLGDEIILNSIEKK
ncbi:MAG: hypothetical protein AB8B72_13525 [Crocinitomicaceae bacterium]